MQNRYMYMYSFMMHKRKTVQSQDQKGAYEGSNGSIEMAVCGRKYSKLTC